MFRSPVAVSGRVAAGPTPLDSIQHGADNLCQASASLIVFRWFLGETVKVRLFVCVHLRSFSTL